MYKFTFVGYANRYDSTSYATQGLMKNGDQIYFIMSHRVSTTARSIFGLIDSATGSFTKVWNFPANLNHLTYKNVALVNSWSHNTP
jgi:hypothetical protein